MNSHENIQKRKDQPESKWTEHLASAARAWDCSEAAAQARMQEIVANMRQIHFAASFWPDLHVHVQSATAARQPLPPMFHERLAEALATLSTYDLATIRIDFRTFPIAGPEDVETRAMRLGTPEDGRPRLLFRFVGARRAVAGTHILVTGIDF